MLTFLYNSQTIYDGRDPAVFFVSKPDKMTWSFKEFLLKIPDSIHRFQGLGRNFSFYFLFRKPPMA